MSDECSSYVHGSAICRDGFPIKAICMGHRCFSCGVWSKELPLCLSEGDLPPHLFDESGKPQLAAMFDKVRRS